MTITQLQEAIDTNLTASGADKITAAELRTVMGNIKDELLARGITIVADTTALAALSGANYKAAIVESNGVFKWLSSGTANGTTIFAAAGGGTWNRIISVTGGGASAINDLTDVTITSAATGDSLEYNGSAFVNVNKTFTELTGTTWDGSNKYKTSLSGNLALTLNSTKVAGILVIEDNNSHTLTINGTSVPVNATTATQIGFTKANGVYYITDKDGLTITVAGPDVTAPTVISATAIDANTIEVVLSEAVTLTNSGWSFKQNGSTITPDSVTGSGTDTLQFVFSETMLDTDTILRSYNSATGNTIDASGNELVTFTDQAVDNEITSQYGTDITVFDKDALMTKVGTEYISDAAAYIRVNAITTDSLTGNGSFVIDMLDAGPIYGPEFGMKTTQVKGNYTTWIVGLVKETNKFRVYENGVSGTLISTVIINDDKVELQRTGTTVKARLFRAGVWSDLYTFSTSVSGTVYMGFTAVDDGTYVSKVSNPRIKI